MNERERDPRDRIYWMEGLKLAIKVVLIGGAAMVALGVLGILFEELTGWKLRD